jgi:hypothetical protein
MMIHLLPDVGKIEGLRSQPEPATGFPQGLLALQYTDRKGAWQELRIPTLDALYLLNLLEQWSTHEDNDLLRRPPG